MFSIKDIKCSDKIDKVLKKLNERNELQFRYNVQQHYKICWTSIVKIYLKI